MARSATQTVAAVLLVMAALPALAGPAPKNDPDKLRADYISRLQQQNPAPPDTRTLGSLWVSNGLFSNIASDYKARQLNDAVVITVSVQTTSTNSASVNNQRNFQTASGISGLVGDIATKGVNPLLNAQSATTLKGQGQVASNSSLQTSLSGRVIAVLPNGNLVVEAERQILMNNQRETMVVRGVARPNDIANDNSISAALLGSLEVELKGKGVISDSTSTRPANPLMRAILWVFGM